MNALDFNHAMIYTRDVARALTFYRDSWGSPSWKNFAEGIAWSTPG
jgi:catechol 2,3-dioxygenase-like lactoylglutathione lyase family enzyme